MTSGEVQGHLHGDCLSHATDLADAWEATEACMHQRRTWGIPGAAQVASAAVMGLLVVASTLGLFGLYAKRHAHRAGGPSWVCRGLTALMRLLPAVRSTTTAAIAPAEYGVLLSARAAVLRCYRCYWRSPPTSC